MMAAVFIQLANFNDGLRQSFVFFPPFTAHLLELAISNELPKRLRSKLGAPFLSDLNAANLSRAELRL